MKHLIGIFFFLFISLVRVLFARLVHNHLYTSTTDRFLRNLRFFRVCFLRFGFFQKDCTPEAD